MTIIAFGLHRRRNGTIALNLIWKMTKKIYLKWMEMQKFL
jgi:hypothetical protein